MGGSTYPWPELPGLTFDESADRMFLLANDPLAGVHLNIPSINVPLLPGRVDDHP